MNLSRDFKKLYSYVSWVLDVLYILVKNNNPIIFDFIKDLKKLVNLNGLFWLDYLPEKWDKFPKNFWNQIRWVLKYSNHFMLIFAITEGDLLKDIRVKAEEVANKWKLVKEWQYESGY